MTTEHEKLLNGQDYDYRDPELQEMLGNARSIVRELNETIDIATRQSLMQRLFAKVGENTIVNGTISVLYGKHMTVGKQVFINDGCRFQDSNLIELGDLVIIAPDVKFYCGQHDLDVTKRFDQRDGQRRLITTTAPISVGSETNRWQCNNHWWR